MFNPSAISSSQFVSTIPIPSNPTNPTNPTQPNPTFTNNNNISSISSIPTNPSNPTNSSISSNSSNSIPSNSSNSTFTIPSNSIFTNASNISSIPSTSFNIPTASSIPSKKIGATHNKSNRIPQEKITITEAFDTTTSVYEQFKNIINNCQKLYPYNNEQLISPYENECPLASSLLCNPSSATNLIRFDSMLLSVKLTEFKDEPAKIYQVSILDLKKYYDINPKSMLAFKSHYKLTPQTIYNKNNNYLSYLKNQQQQYINAINSNPQLQAEYASEMKKIDDKIKYIEKENQKLVDTIKTLQSKDSSIIIYNTATYPITDKSGKWLTISYLIPFLMFASPLFINHTSNLLNNLLIATSYNSVIGIDQTTSKPIYLNSYLSSLPSIKYINSQFADPKFKPHTSSKTDNSDSTTATTQFVHKLIIQSPKPIIPRLISNDPSSETTYKAFVTQDVINMFNTNQFDLAKLKAFYTNLSKIAKLLNPADMLCVAAFNRLKSLQSQISIIKIDSDKIDTQGNIIDQSILKKLKGIKEKKVKVKNSQNEIVETIIESQEMYNYNEATIEPKATLQNIHKYAVSIKQLNMSDEGIKKIKTKVDGDINTFNSILELSRLQDKTETGPNGLPIIVRQGFLTWINSQKKSAPKSTGTKRKTASAIKGADVEFATDNDNGIGNENENEIEFSQSENMEEDGNNFEFVDAEIEAL